MYWINFPVKSTPKIGSSSKKTPKTSKVKCSRESLYMAKSTNQKHLLNAYSTNRKTKTKTKKSLKDSRNLFKEKDWKK